MSLADDAALVERFRAGDGKAFELLVARHTRYAGAVALGVVGEYHAALDVVQESFIKALEGVWGLENPQRFRSWLRNVVRTTALDYLRRRKVVGRSGERLPGQGESDSQPLPFDGLAPGEALEQNELRELIRNEVVALPETQREVVYLKYLEGMSYEEISHTTGLTINTIESRLFRARARLRERLGRHLDLDSGNGRSS